MDKGGALKIEKHGEEKLHGCDVKQKSSLANYTKEAPLPETPFGTFPKEVDVHVDLLSLSPPRKLKQTLFGKLSKQAQDVASYCLSSFPGEYAVTGEASLSVKVFAEHDSGEHVSVHYSCSFKAMTVCEGCGAFCHIDCIGPSKLCVLCLVIR